MWGDHHSLLSYRCYCEQQCVRRLSAAHRRPSVQPRAGVCPARPRGRRLPQELRGQTAAGPRPSGQPGAEAAETGRRYSTQTSPVAFTVGVFHGLDINQNISLSWPLIFSPDTLHRSVSSDAAVQDTHQENCGQAEAGRDSRPSPSDRGETVSSLPIRPRGRSNALSDAGPFTGRVFHFQVSRGCTCIILAVRCLSAHGWDCN